jgi:hypothetical protein
VCPKIALRSANSPCFLEYATAARAHRNPPQGTSHSSPTQVSPTHDSRKRRSSPVTKTLRFPMLSPQHMNRNFQTSSIKKYSPRLGGSTERAGTSGNSFHPKRQFSRQRLKFPLQYFPLPFFQTHKRAAHCPKSAINILIVSPLCSLRFLL